MPFPTPRHAGADVARFHISRQHFLAFLVGIRQYVDHLQDVAGWSSGLEHGRRPSGHINCLKYSGKYTYHLLTFRGSLQESQTQVVLSKRMFSNLGRDAILLTDKTVRISINIEKTMKYFSCF